MSVRRIGNGRCKWLMCGGEGPTDNRARVNICGEGDRSCYASEQWASEQLTRSSDLRLACKCLQCLQYSRMTIQSQRFVWRKRPEPTIFGKTGSMNSAGWGTVRKRTPWTANAAVATPELRGTQSLPTAQALRSLNTIHWLNTILASSIEYVFFFFNISTVMKAMELSVYLLCCMFKSAQ